MRCIVNGDWYYIKIQARNLQLEQPPTLDQGGLVAELSRPLRRAEKKFRAKRRKPQGRKTICQPHDAILYNWFTLFLFRQIENSRIHAGGPKWSTQAIVRDLKKRDSVVFRKLSRTTMDECCYKGLKSEVRSLMYMESILNT